MCCVSVVVAQTGDSNGQSARFLMPNGAALLARDVTMTVKSGIPVFRATVQNDSGAGWVDVAANVGIRAKCPDVRSIRFQASLGGLPPGVREVSDAIVSARRDFVQDCELVGVDSITVSKGSLESASEARAREERMKSDEAEKKRIRAAIEIDAQHVKDLKAAQDAEQHRMYAEAERKEALDAEARRNCHVIFKDTADKKVADLTVREAQAVHACQALGYYE